MRLRGTMLVLAAVALVSAGCADRTAGDAAAEHVTRAPELALERIARESRRHWLLMGTDGWCDAHVTRYGGDAEDPGVAIVRTARFRSDAHAAGGFASLDPDHLYRMFAVKMLRPPQYVAYPEPLPGDETFVIAYAARLPFELPAGQEIEGQMIAVRAGPFVTVIENIGVPPEQIAPAVGAIVRAAEERAAAGC